MKSIPLPLFPLVFVVVFALVFAACGGGDETADTPTSAPSTATAAPPTATPLPATPTSTPVPPTPTPTPTPEPALPGDPVVGRQVFESASPIACSVCHSLDGTVGLGPSQQGIATRAATQVSGLSAEEYIRQSILEPNAFMVGGFPSGLMPPTFGETLTPKQLDDVVSFLLTLK